MRVAVSTVGRTPDDPRVWSGTPAGVVGGMERSSRFSPVLLAPPRPRLHFAGRALSFVTKRMPGDHKINWEIERGITRRMTRHLLRQSAAAGVEATLAVGWQPLCPPGTTQFVAFWNDATYAQQLDLHPHWSHLGAHSRQQMESTEGDAMRSMSAVILTSRWAADDALARYRLDPDRVHVVPLGANIPTPEVVVRRQPDAGQVRLLAIGVEWHRKGLDLAVLTADALRGRGIEATLDVVGVDPPDASWHRPYVTFHGFLSKRDAAQAEQIASLYKAADVFLFPSREEPYGVVLCEAAAYSLPVVATNTNAIPEIVEDGQTGTLVAPSSTPEAWADAVLRTVDGDYIRRAAAARAAFETRLNWDACITQLADALGAR